MTEKIQLVKGFSIEENITQNDLDGEHQEMFFRGEKLEEAIQGYFNKTTKWECEACDNSVYNQFDEIWEHIDDSHDEFDDIVIIFRGHKIKLKTFFKKAEALPEEEKGKIDFESVLKLILNIDEVTTPNSSQQ